MAFDERGGVLGFIPEQPTLTALLPTQEKIQFTQWVSKYFAEIGKNGVPQAATDPMATYRYLSNKADLRIKAAQQRPMLRIADKSLSPVLELTQEMSCSYEEVVHDTGQAKVVATYEDWIVDYIVNMTNVDEDLHLLIDPNPGKRSWKTRWSGKIHQINVKRNEDGTSTIELIALSMREHAKKLLIASNPLFAAEFQLPKQFVLPGPLRSILFAAFGVNLARLFTPGLTTISNLMNPLSWINPINDPFQAAAQVDPTQWPIQMAFVNVAIDQSRWSAITASWSDWHSATQDMLKDCGVILRAYTYLVDEDGDEESPHSELEDILTGTTKPMVDLFDVLGMNGASKRFTNLESAVAKDFARPKRNCVVFRLEDMSGQTGPTGTAWDGLLNLIGVTLDDMVTSVLVDANTGQTLDGQPIIDVLQPETPIFEALLGVAPEVPKCIWREGQFDRVPEKQHTVYKAAPKTLMTGGRSPAIVNQGIQFGIRYAIQQISNVIQVPDGPDGATAIQAFPMNGLGELYQGQLSNVVLAWERLTLPVRAVWNGDLAYQEFMARGSGVAYTLASVLTLREAEFKTRPYYGFQAKVISGFPWVLDEDIRLGERGGWEFDNIIYVDQITALKRQWDRHSPVLPTLSVGGDQDREDPIARSMRGIQSLYSVVGAILGEGVLS